MSVSGEIKTFVKNWESGRVFTYGDLPVDDKAAAAPVLSRLVKQGTLRRLRKGAYYKPKTGILGEVPPAEGERVRSYLRQLGEDAYPTGIRVFNQMGLTTQVSNEITLAGRGTPRTVQLDNLTIKIAPIKPAPSRSRLSPEEVPLAQLLDALDRIKQIPGATPDDVVRYLKQSIAAFSDQDRHRLVELTKARRPRTRAIVGAVCKELGCWIEAGELKSTLNPQTGYNTGISDAALHDRSRWKIR